MEENGVSLNEKEMYFKHFDFHFAGIPALPEKESFPFKFSYEESNKSNGLIRLSTLKALISSGDVEN